jgi:hypothetical protein
VSTYSEYYLEHHGIKGMKWGVRKEKRKGYTPEEKARIRRTRNANLILAGLSGLAVGAGFAMQATKGRSYVSEALKGGGIGLGMAGISNASVEQGKLITNKLFRD